jgi:hypothetical protein
VSDVIDMHNLLEYLRILQHSPAVDNEEKQIVSLWEIKWRYTREVVDRVRNKAQAHLLAISRTQLYRLLSNKPAGDSHQHGMDRARSSV